jgi:F0F1-type ATP synthase membrane subunit b/b'
MKVVSEYLAEAAKFEKMAAEEKENREFRQTLLRQAQAYRKLAEERARKLGQEIPVNQGPPQSN